MMLHLSHARYVELFQNYAVKKFGRLSLPVHSPKAFRASLRALEAAEIVVRHDMSGIVLYVEYDFAENMRPTMSRRNNK